MNEVSKVRFTPLFTLFNGEYFVMGWSKNFQIKQKIF